MDKSDKYGFINFQPKHDFLVCIDSDGSVFNSMEIKHRECFIPQIINYWNLQPISKYVREVAEFVNLYSQWRGINRFPALVKTFDLLRERVEVRRRNISIPELSSLRTFIASGVPLGNKTLEKVIAKSGNKELKQSLAWSLAINAAVTDLGVNIPPFPSVKESLEKLSSVADIIVVSVAPVATLTREWEAYGLDEYVDIIAGQEMGDKRSILQAVIDGKYQENHVVMIGDAPADMRAAHFNRVLFYPIVPGKEKASWKKFYIEIIDLFISGKYTKASEAEFINEFQAHLPARPPWI